MTLICSNTCWGKERACAITTSLIAIAYLSLPLSQEAFSGLSSAVKNDSAADRMETQNKIEFKSTAGTWTLGTRDHKVIAVRQGTFSVVCKKHIGLPVLTADFHYLVYVCRTIDAHLFNLQKNPKSVWFFLFYGQTKIFTCSKYLFIKVVTSKTVENGFSYSFWHIKDTKCPMKYDYIAQDIKIQITEGSCLVFGLLVFFFVKRLGFMYSF